MASLANKGLTISQNVFFKFLLQRAALLFGKPAKIGMLLREAYQKLVDTKSDKSGFAQIRDIMLLFIRLVRAYLKGDYRAISKKSIIIGIATLLYVVSPIDLVPDFIPVLGFADDISLMAWFIKAFQTELTKFKEWEQGLGIMPT
jgi:uncharacterized membrane protein YkvA (DUF1232 family)